MWSSLVHVNRGHERLDSLWAEFGVENALPSFSISFFSSDSQRRYDFTFQVWEHIQSCTSSVLNLVGIQLFIMVDLHQSPS